MLLSVIIPTRNRADRLSDLLDSLAAQEPVPFDWEVVVVDNASGDNTSQLVASKKRILPIRIRYVLELNLGLHHGRHRGVKEASAPHIAYLDDDMILTPTWLQGVDHVVKGQADAVIGRILPKWQSDPPGWLLEMSNQGVFSYLGLLDLGDQAQPVKPQLVFGGNSFFPKKLIFELGGFNPDGVPKDMLCYRGDGETALMAKFKHAGLRSYYDPRATAYHVIDKDRMTVEYLCQRAYNQGISNSFSQIRAAYGVDGIERSNKTENILLRGVRFTSSLVKRILKKGYMMLKGDTNSRIKRQLDMACRSGWLYHQKLFKDDPEIRKYILRKTYLE